MNATLLIVEDDEQMGGLLQRGFRDEGHTVVLLRTAKDALAALERTTFDAAAIDVMLPRMTGFELCRRIRSSGTTMPVILITARGAVEDRITGLDAGADDYLVKPFAFAELSARMRAHLRREMSARRPLQSGGVVLDTDAVRATVDGRLLPLSMKEFALLRLLMSRPRQTVSRLEILEEVWGSSHYFDPTLVDQYIRYLRKKMQAHECSLRILTIRGAGYQLDSSPAPP
ncbi:MAG: DNA-binding response regulator [Subtercola sp.]|nr:DNA-binding response regulator [Subtercola sp.]